MRLDLSLVRSPARTVRFPVLAALIAALALLNPWSSNPLAQAGVTGVWQALTSPSQLVPINPIHMGLLTDGRVLMVAGSGNDANELNWRATVWDPIARTYSTQPVSWDMFCNGMVNLPDGRMLINGGNLKYDPFWGEKRSSVFDPDTDVITDLENMAHGRWYPTVTVLGDGRIMTFSGLTETGGTNTSVEIYTVGSGWSQEYVASWTPPLYPWLHLLPNGNVFYSGSSRSSRIFNTSTNTWGNVVDTINLTTSRPYGTSVLLPLSPTDSYTPRVMIFGGSSPGTNTTEVIEPLAASPNWVNGPTMSQGRIQLNATLLPSGRVLVTGGSLNDEQAASASLNADLFTVEGTMSRTSAGANAYARLYHSNALLLPDATVLLAGGNPDRGSYEQRLEIYSPAYLFNPDNSPATRPTTTGGPTSSVNYGATFQIQTPNAGSISSVVAIRPGTPTHAFNMDQRMVRLSFTQGTGVLNVVAPPNGNVAPPGYYMIFILNSTGVPSIARFVQFLPTSGGGGATTLTATPATVTAGDPVTATWANISNPTGRDWVGVYTPAAGDQSYLTWAYVNCSQTPGAPVASGSCVLAGTSGLAAGTYQMRLFRNDSYTKIATSNNFVVNPGGGGPVTVTATPASVVAGNPETVQWSGITGAAARDWIALFPVGAGDLAYIDWRYVSCTQTPGAAVPAGSCAFTIGGGVPAGTYEFRMFRNDGPVKLGTSNTFTVTAGAGTTLSVTPTTIARGSAVTATWANLSSPTSTDWIGLHTSTAGDTTYLAWIYVSCTQSPTVPKASGSCSFTIPATVAPGTYNLRLFRNNQSVKAATSQNFTVTP